MNYNLIKLDKRYYKNNFILWLKNKIDNSWLNLELLIHPFIFSGSLVVKWEAHRYHK